MKNYLLQGLNGQCPHQIFAKESKNSCQCQWKHQIEELEVPVEGQEYSLALRVLSRFERPSDGFARKTIFSTSVDLLAFDESCNVFSGILPFACPREIVLKATIIGHLDERVRLEHVIRSMLLLRIRAS